VAEVGTSNQYRTISLKVAGRSCINKQTYGSKLCVLWLWCSFDFLSYRHTVVFVRKYLCLLSVGKQLVEHRTLSSHLLHVSAVLLPSSGTLYTNMYGKEYRGGYEGNASTWVFFSIHFIVKFT
jgi:hypothetical protein